MPNQFVLAVDQGTTSSRVVVIDGTGTPINAVSRELRQIYPKPGWVEHDPVEIWQATRDLLRAAVDRVGGAGQVAAIGITNQRETTVVWDRETGAPVYNAVVWQDRRTADLCAELRSDGLGDHVQSHTGLLIDPYFSATKVAWILDNVDGARARAGEGGLCFGTVDSWLIWNLTGGASHVTDFSNAARTMLYDIAGLNWDETLLERLSVPASMLPEVRPSQGYFGTTLEAEAGVAAPILGVAGDQQAATFGQACFEPGMIKSTYGTGCFMLANSGPQMASSKNRLLSTIAWNRGGCVDYALEGSIFMAGATVQWLRDELGLIAASEDSEAMAQKAAAASGVYLVPAFAGLGAPYWDADARGAITGLTRGAGAAEIVRAGLESVAFQSRDLIEAMAQDMESSGLARPSRIRVDGGMTQNAWFLQCLADQLGVPVERARYAETTALGAGFLAALEAGLSSSLDQIAGMWSADRTFEPQMSEDERDTLYSGWHKAVERVIENRS